MKTSYAVIMAGGVGSRYWPVSRAAHPKQFIDILGTGKSLLRQTFERFNEQIPADRIYVVTNTAYVELVKQQLPELDPQQILGEPVGKNTAPCVAYACFKIAKDDPDATVIVAPSDHLILDKSEFFRLVNIAADTGRKQSSLITIGITPNRPDTGYGYIQFLEKKAKTDVFRVKTFTEKPNLELAKTFISSGDFLWNAGIFIFKITTFKSALKKYLPEMNAQFAAGEGVYGTSAEQKFVEGVYQHCASISMDYGIMEKADNVQVVSGDFGWSDLGTWNSLHDIMPKDAHQNSIVGERVRLYNTSDSVVNMPKGKLVVLNGVKNLIVVEADNILLICDKEREQEVRQIVTDVKLEWGDKYI